jgi:FAD/FMN-containing dehydrogenase/Fe-S oxidoreductase
MTAETLPGARLDRAGLSEEARHALEGALRAAISGDVLFDGATRGIYATDSSNYRQVPLGVIYPVDEADVIAALRVCHEHNAPVLGRGGGTGLAGQTCNVAVVFDFSRRMNRILEIDPKRRIARVQPGVVLDDLRAAAEVHGLTFGPDPATHAWCTIGGMIGNNSCGTHALYAGKTVDNVERLTAVTYDGARIELGACDDDEYARISAVGGESARIHAGIREVGRRYADLVRERYPQIPRRVSGFNLDQLLPENGFHVARALVGTESTCALVTEATLHLATSPKHRRLVVVGFSDVYTAADNVPHLLRHQLLGLEGFDDTLIAHMRAKKLHLPNLTLLPPGAGWLLAEVGDDDPAEADRLAQQVLDDIPAGATALAYTDPIQQKAVWAIREAGLGATAQPVGEPHNHEGWEDAAVAPEKLGLYLRGIAELWKEYGYHGAWYGHFGQGCVHTRNNFDFSTVEGLRTYRAYVERAADLCVSLGGSLSGEHGDGQSRGELLEKMFGPELIDAFRQFKAVWDPQGRMNPGKVVDPYPLDTNIRYGPSYQTSKLTPTFFSFAEDSGSMQTAAERCVGVGRCRNTQTGVMCPSYRATKDEKHSTRGRAKLLVEMFQGETTPQQWRNDEVFEALDLCLSCKGCAVDCPTHVDMATYKAEFLAHYYKGRLRPRSAYALGLIPWASRLASRIPRLANLALGDNPLGRLVKRSAGISSKRPAPKYARSTFRRSTAPGATDATVILWPDTFTDVYKPERGEAVRAVLASAGERVGIPEQWGCCGRPLYDMGMLKLARKTLRQVLDILTPALDAGLPVIVPEPSCLATFRDELPKILADDPRSAKLAALSRSLSEHLLAIGWQPPAPAGGRSVAVHPHCHQRAAVGTEADRQLLLAAGFDVTILDAGCCGLAGSFGFKAEHDPLSRQIAEQAFLPALRGLEPQTMIVMDGFSCVTQADHLGGPASTGLAELLMATVCPKPEA